MAANDVPKQGRGFLVAVDDLLGSDRVGVDEGVDLERLLVCETTINASARLPGMRLLDYPLCVQPDYSR